MLGIQYKKIESNSVGYKTDYQMHSLDFEEFLWACGYDHSIRTTLLNHMVTQTPFSPGILSTFFSLFMDFCILGGMPAVVRDYIANQTFEGSLNTQRQLLADYREDVRKYASGVDQTRILNVFEHIPVQLAKDNKKFQISKVAPNARFKDYRGCIEWLHDAGIINICYCLSFPELPVNVPPPTEAGASCFNENSTTAPRNCCGLHSLHRRRFPCDPRYFMRYVRQIFA